MPRSSPPRTPVVADLIGDVDPMKVAEGRHLGDPETIHFGLIPRSHRGIVAINELPDLAERIQVAMLNVMEERDIQIRGYVVRLPLDVLVVASANPRTTPTAAGSSRR
jgi:magnesium chelatase subunit I